MTKNVISVDSEIKISEIAELMAKHRIHGVPVTTKGKLVGIVTETDFFVKDLPNLYLPSYINFLKETKVSGKLKNNKKEEIKKILEARASDIMTKKCISFSPDSEVADMIKIIKTKHLFSFPVVDKNNKVVGIVTQADIIKLI